jgi:hypothetical protein
VGTEKLIEYSPPEECLPKKRENGMAWQSECGRVRCGMGSEMAAGVGRQAKQLAWQLVLYRRH